MRTARIFRTAAGNTFLHLYRGDTLIAVYNCGKSLHNPQTDWQLILGYMADWIEDGQYPDTFE